MPDNAPAIGEGAVPGLVWATGHWRNGVLLAPVTADAVARLIAGGDVAPEIEPFTPRRFAPAAAAQAEVTR
jgi:glycine oxidase